MSHEKHLDHLLLAELTTEEREVAMRRHQIIEALLKYERPPKEAYVQAAEQGQCSVKTIRRWQKRYKSDGLAGLVNKRRKDKGRRRVISLDAQRLIEALYLEHGHRSFRNVHRLIKAYAEKEGLPVPSYSMVRDICHALPQGIVCMAREGEQSWRNQFEPVLRFESSRPNECWQMDHSKLDILVLDDAGELLGRPWLTIALDTYSRAIMGYYLSLTTPSSLTICVTLRNSILCKPLDQWPMCGFPERLHIDRGRDFTSRHVEQVAADFNIKLSFATPYLARAKGKVERFFGTLNQQLWCELPGYVGSNVADRPHLVKPALTLKEAESYLVSYLVTAYHQQVHRTTGESPLIRWQQAEFTPRMPESDRALDLLLMLVEKWMVQRDGIQFYHLHYWHPELAAHIGQQIRVRYDPEDIREIVVYHDNRFVCVATAAELEDLQISLADWRALQARRRRSTQELVFAYREWLEAKRTGLVPILTREEVDLAILMERTITAKRANEPLLFSLDEPRGQEASDECD